MRLTGEGGFIPELVKAVLERGLQAELTDHLGYEQGDPAGRGRVTPATGARPRRCRPRSARSTLDVPRDRARHVRAAAGAQGTRRLGGLDDMIICLYAGGMTVRDIEHHLPRRLGTELSHETICNITDAVLEEVKAWQTRPLDAVYPIVYLDALVVKVRDGAHGAQQGRPHRARRRPRRRQARAGDLGADQRGRQVLGRGAAPSWRNRGVRDILIACCDGLTGLPEAIEATCPQTIVQTCVVHLIRASMRFVPTATARPSPPRCEPIYTAADGRRRRDRAARVRRLRPGQAYPAAVAAWERAWDRFTPFLAFPPAVRKVIYTTNASSP